MKLNYFIGTITSIMILTSCGGTEPSSTGRKGPISEERSYAFKSFMPTFSSMRKMVNGDEAFEAEKFKKLATQFVEEAHIPFNYFQNDPQGNGDALPNIWSNEAEFKAEQEHFLSAVDELNQAAQTGKLDTIKPTFNKAASSCRSCHDTYRAPK